MRRKPIEIGKNCLLHVKPLERIFLNVVGVGKRGGKSRLDPHTLQHILRTRPAQQVISGQIGCHAGDEFYRSFGRLAILVPKGNFMPRAREGNCPRPPYQSTPDDGHMTHDVLLCTIS